MKVLVLACAAVFALGCASSPDDEGRDEGDAGIEVGMSDYDYTVVCPRGWHECKELAMEYCPGGYKETRRAGYDPFGGPTADSRAEQVFRRGGRTAPEDRWMTIRCN